MVHEGNWSRNIPVTPRSKDLSKRKKELDRPLKDLRLKLHEARTAE